MPGPRWARTVDQRPVFGHVILEKAIEKCYKPLPRRCLDAIKARGDATDPWPQTLLPGWRGLVLPQATDVPYRFTDKLRLENECLKGSTAPYAAVTIPGNSGMFIQQGSQVVAFHHGKVDGEGDRFPISCY